MKKTLLLFIYATSLAACVISLTASAQEKLTPPAIGDAEAPVAVQSDDESSKKLDQEISASDTELFDAMKQAKIAKLREITAKASAEVAKANAETKKANNGELAAPMGSPATLQMMQAQQMAQMQAQAQKVAKPDEEPKAKKTVKVDASPTLTVLMVSGESARIRAAGSTCDVVVGSSCGGLTVTDIFGNSVKAKNSSGRAIVESISDPYQYPVNEIKPVVKPDQKQPQGMKK